MIGNHEFCRPKDQYKLRSIHIQVVDWSSHEENKTVESIKLFSEITNDKGESLFGQVYSRGGTAAMLLVLQPDDVPQYSDQDKHILMTIQTRVAVGSLRFTEVPTGMFDENGSFSGEAASKIKKETGMVIEAKDLLNMTALALPPEAKLEERLQRSVYSTPGRSDEYTPGFLYQRRIPRAELQKYQSFLTGLRDEGEKIGLKLVRLEDLWKVGAGDAKALGAVALYRGLKWEGKI